MSEGYSTLVYHIVDRILIRKPKEIKYTKEFIRALEIKDNLETLEAKLNSAIKEDIGIISVDNLEVRQSICGKEIQVSVNYV